MATYRYRAYDNRGKLASGKMEASGRNDALQRLKGLGLHPVEVKEAEAAGKGRKVPTGDLALATRQLSTLLASGTSLTEALSVLTGNMDNERLKTVFGDIREAVTGGSSLSGALLRHPHIFSPFYRGLVASGEASGSLERVLPRLAAELESRARLITEMRAALAYPLLMLLVGAGVLAFLFVFVIPKITRIFEDTGGSLPFITVLLIRTAELISGYWPVFIAFGVAAYFGVRRTSKSGRGRERIENLALDLPFAGKLIALFYLSAFTRTLGSLLAGGIQLLKALEITKEVVGHTAFRKAIDEAASDCAGGMALSTSLAKCGRIPPLVIHMIKVGEKSGSLDDMLLRAAEGYEAELQAGIKKTMSLIEPALILAMGAVVGFIVLTILLPIFELNQVIR
ncbi:MAG: type II secretion system F family protein [Candidatus Methylomirabilis sp.]|nr:type II secretion system F family protein [Deltaproteobacteria bacterium]